MLIKNGLVVTLDDERRVIRDGAVAFEDDRIVAVGKTRDLEPVYGSDVDMDASGKTILPGLVNTHSHLYQSIMRGLSDDGEGRGRQGRWRWDIELLRNLDRDACHAAARLSILEMIKSGVTCTQDSHYINFHRDAVDGVGEAAAETGVRLVLGRGSWDLPGLAPDELTETIPEALRESRSMARRWHGKADGRIKAILEASLLSQVSDELITETKGLANDLGLGWAMHLQQRLGTHRDDPRTGDLRLTEYAGRAVEYLERLGVLGPDSLLIHCTFVDEREIAILAETETPVAHCPCANAWAGRRRVTDVPAMLKHGVTVGLGTDGALTNDSLDMFHSMNFCALIHKVNKDSVHAMTAEKTLELATIDAAKALGLGKELGSLEPGKKADITIVDMRCPGMTPSLLPVKNLVYSAGGGQCVDTVIVDGVTVMEGRRTLSFDEAEVLEEGEKAGLKLLERSGHMDRDPGFLSRGDWKHI